MGDGRLALAHAFHVVVRQEVGMGENGAAAKQAEAIERLGIGDAMARQHIAMRPVALRTVRLHVAAAFLGQCSQSFKRRIGAGRDEARGDDGQDTSLAIIGMRVDIVDQRPCTLDGRFRRGVAIVVRAFVHIVHRHLADQRALALLKADVGQRTGRILVHGGEIERRGRAVGEQIIDQQAIAAPCEGEVFVAGLQREGVFLQPDFQRHVEGAAELRVLRGMDVKIDKAGDQVRAGWQGDQLTGLFARIPDRAVVRIGRAVDGADRSVCADVDQDLVQNVDLSTFRCMKAGGAERLVTQIQCYVPKFSQGFSNRAIISARRNLRQISPVSMSEALRF
jgi:hypothetical protein